jgi:hypothetical protein
VRAPLPIDGHERGGDARHEPGAASGDMKAPPSVLATPARARGSRASSPAAPSCQKPQPALLLDVAPTLPRRDRTAKSCPLWRIRPCCSARRGRARARRSDRGRAPQGPAPPTTSAIKTAG